MQKKRVKEDIRYVFTLDEKKEMLKRTKGVCAHCGKTLTVGTKDCTAEHIVPISKGGKNEKNNLICMCKKCNLDKGNDIVPPNWYNYITEEEKPAVKRLIFRYFKDYCHISKNNLLPVDQWITSIEFNAKYGDCITDESGKVIKVTKKVTWRKANYHTDFDRIVEIYEKYNLKNNLHNDSVKNGVRTLFNVGCIYYLESGNKDIKAIVPFFMSNMYLDQCMKKSIYGSSKVNKTVPSLYFTYVINCTSKFVYARAIYDFVHFVVMNMCKTLDTSIMLHNGICFASKTLVKELRYFMPEEGCSLEDNSLYWSAFYSEGEEGKVSDEEFQIYIKKTTSKIKEFDIQLDNAKTINDIFRFGGKNKHA